MSTPEAQYYQSLVYPYRRSPDQDAPAPVRHPVVIIGAGPVGLSLGIDLAHQGVPALIIDDDDRLSFGSRAVCYAKRTLEIFDRLGCGQRMVDKGVSWNLGKVFLRDEEVYAFNLLPEEGHERPAFINLQQYYLEGYLSEHAATLPGLEIRHLHKLVDVQPGAQRVHLTIETPDGPYRIDADWVVACDGSRSTTRRLLGLESKGRVFRDRFLIADVRMQADYPTERWFWFDPPFHRGQSALLHRQPDNVWRLDFQLGWDVDPEAEKQPERVIPRVKAMLGDRPFELEWCSVYTFACMRMERFRHGRVIFAGDAAHGVSPFGARGANSGVQDTDNLSWKLKAVLQGPAGDALIDSYGDEREAAADENILNSTRSTDFITPKSAVSRLFRDEVLGLARDCEFARRLVNSGRLSMPATYVDSPLNTPDVDAFAGTQVPGAPVADAPVDTSQGPAWFLRQFGDRFRLVVYLDPAGLPADAPTPWWCGPFDLPLPLSVLAVLPAGAQAARQMQLLRDRGIDSVVDRDGLVARRLDARPGTIYLIRPDQHVAARWRRADAPGVHAAMRRALAL